MSRLFPLRKIQWLWLLTSLCWVAMLITAFGFLLQYESTPGLAGSPSPSWPESTALSASGAGLSLVMFAHPRCPCTSASLDELDLLLRQCPNWASVRVVCVCPKPEDTAWTESKLVQQVRRLAGVELCWDSDGQQAALFGVETSGHVLAYDANGGLKFSGGITPFRSHSGNNPGRESLMALHDGHSVPFPETAVFGCPLRNAGSDCRDQKCQVQP